MPTQIAEFPSACWFWRVCCQHKSNTNPTQPNTNCRIPQRLLGLARVLPTQIQHKTSTTQHKLQNPPAPAGFGACVANTNPTQIQHSPTQIAEFPSACWVWRVCCQHKSNTKPAQPNTNCKIPQRLLGLARVLPTQIQHKLQNYPAPPDWPI